MVGMISQAGIIIFGATAIFLVGLKDDNPWRRWGFVCGIFHSLSGSVQHGKLNNMALCAIYFLHVFVAKRIQ